MPAFPGFDAMLMIWGAAVLTWFTIRHFYFGGTCIQIELPAHPPFWARRKQGTAL